MRNYSGLVVVRYYRINNKNSATLRSVRSVRSSLISLPCVRPLNYLGSVRPLIYLGSGGSRVPLNSLGRKYSQNFLATRGSGGSSNLFRILSLVYSSKANNFVSNIENQMCIEEIVFDEYVDIFNNYKGYDTKSFNTSILTGILKEYIINKQEDLIKVVTDMISFNNDSLSSNKKMSEINRYICTVINGLDSEFILNLCLVHFLIVCSSQKSEDTENYTSIHVAISIGKKMIRKYLYLLKCSDIAYKDVSYSV